MDIGILRYTNDEFYHANVKHRETGEVVNTVNVATNNSLTESIIYEIEFLYGTTEILASNVIVENLLSQV